MIVKTVHGGDSDQKSTGALTANLFREFEKRQTGFRGETVETLHRSFASPPRYESADRDECRGAGAGGKRPWRITDQDRSLTGKPRKIPAARH
jgi:hypothetical protein